MDPHPFEKTPREDEGCRLISRPYGEAHGYFGLNKLAESRKQTDLALRIRQQYGLRQYHGILDLDAKLTALGFPSENQHAVAEGKEP